MGGGGRREAGGGGEGEGARDTESKTRTPHKDVGKNTISPSDFSGKSRCSEVKSSSQTISEEKKL